MKELKEIEHDSLCPGGKNGKMKSCNEEVTVTVTTRSVGQN